MSLEDAIEFCESWLDTLAILADIEVQKRAWFEHEGELVTSYGDEIEKLEVNSEELARDENAGLLNQECTAKINRVINLVKSFEKSPEFPVNIALPEKLFNDPKWIEIVNAAEEAYNALLAQKKELESHDE